ncbi:KptA family-domain-containing protein [Gymnopilus junonius]|uniref:2'-phosphotransferase n=1 Tax=Gymnopilus junonius TaxID=109634 RepID=A0A9P5NSJ1_GYMJU|nr:KptA family-domain-containing protein [Gymnopilus junonius]
MDQTTSEVLAKLSISDHAGPSSSSNAKKGGKDKGKERQKQAPKANSNPSKSTKLRGLDRDSPEVRVSKTLSWILRHGAQSEGLAMRKDGYIKLVDLLENPKLKSQNLDLEKIKAIVTADKKQRFDLILESSEGFKLLVWGAQPASTPDATTTSTTTTVVEDPNGIWWIKARQGHSIKDVELELKPVNALSDIPTGMAVHGTNRIAWKLISKDGLSRMTRNHIHLAQNVAGQNVVSGMRTSSQVLIYIHVQRALDAGVKFWLSDNGVVLTEGDEQGYLSKAFFEKVVDVKHGELTGWESS